MIIIKINKKKLRKIAEAIASGIFLITFFLMLGFAGSYETGSSTTGQFITRILPTLAGMAVSAMIMNKIDEKEAGHE